MAEIRSTLFFKNNRVYGVGAIVFDLLISETHNFSSEITQFNIEDGSSISDHIRNTLRTGSVTGLITNFSLYQSGLTSNRAQDAFDALVRLWEARELVTINTILDVYENVVITNISVARGEDSGEALAANFSFSKLKIVKLQEVQIQAVVNLANMNSNINRQAAVNIDAGKTTGVQ